MNIFLIIYNTWCIVGASFMIYFSFAKFFRNESVSAVDLKEFHETDQDLYPSVSICFKSFSGGIFVERDGIPSKKDMYRMMSGKKTMDSGLSNASYEDVTIKLEDFLRYAYLKLDRETASQLISINETFKTTGYSLMKCFTHNIEFVEGHKISSFTFALKPLGGLGLQVKIHHRGQLLRTTGEVFSARSKADGSKVSIILEDLTLYRKRENGPQKCDGESHDDDKESNSNIKKRDTIFWH